MGLTFDLDLGSFEADVARAKASLDRKLVDASFDAAAAGVEEAQENHPYTDRTGQLTERATPRRAAQGEAAMVWGKHYASFVDEGTSRARPYPFTPQAIGRAQAALERQAERVAEGFIDDINKLTD